MTDEETNLPAATGMEKVLDYLYKVSDKWGSDYNPYIIMNQKFYEELKEVIYNNPAIKVVISELYRHKVKVSQFFKEQEKPVAFITPFDLHLMLWQHNTLNPASPKNIEDLLSPKPIVPDVI